MNLKIKKKSINPYSNDFCIIRGGKLILKDAYSLQSKSFVSFLSSFLMSRYLVTQKEWVSLMGYNPSKFIGESYPVHGITWFEAIKFCNKKSTLEELDNCYSENNKCDFSKNGYRLPTECEWEYSARGGRYFKHCNENLVDLETVSWYSGNSYGKVHEIGQKLPNMLGLYDMLGNVWEWCWDWYKEYPYRLKINYKGPENGQYRICRGGCWAVDNEVCTPTYRNDVDPDCSSEYGIGLRLVKKL